MEDEYGYANARLRAMKSRLLKPSDYTALLDAPTIEEVIARLTHTVYQTDIEAALIKASRWACLSEALRRHFSNTLTRITDFFSGNPLRLWQILIGRWQVFNLKTILRGQAQHVRADEIMDALIPAGDLRESDLQRLAQQTTPHATADLLATWHHPLAQPLIEAMPRYAEHSDIAELELALDRAHYAAALAELEELDADSMRKNICSEIDATNILTVLRLSQWGESGTRLAQRYGSSAPAPLLLKGGGIATRILLAYKNVPALDQLVRELHDTEFGDALGRGQTRYNETHLLSAFDEEIEAQLTHQKVALFHHDPLSIDIAIAYVTALVNEIRNLRVIGRAKVAGWKREEIEKELRLWQD